MTRQQASERAQLLLGTASLLIWFAVAFGLAVPWSMAGESDSRIIMAGGIALVAAAVPWLGYHRLVAKLTRPSRGSR